MTQGALEHTRNHARDHALDVPGSVRKNENVTEAQASIVVGRLEGLLGKNPDRSIANSLGIGLVVARGTRHIEIHGEARILPLNRSLAGWDRGLDIGQELEAEG